MPLSRRHENVMVNEIVTLSDVYRAQRNIVSLARNTPTLPSHTLSELCGSPVYLKLETMQDLGAFKIRGATNRIANLSADEKTRGVITVSTGNHGRAVAHVAHHYRIPVIIYLSKMVPKNKVTAIENLGATVKVYGNSQDEAQKEAERLAQEDNLTFVNPFDDPWVIAGQGTIGLELLESVPKIRTAVIPIGGGGLISGISLALKAFSKDIHIVGVSMERGAAMIESQKAGGPIIVEEVETLADCLGGGIGLDNRYTFSMVEKLVDEFIVVSEVQIAAAMAHMYHHDRMIVEGGGAVGVAALLHGLIPNLIGPTVVVLSGNNVDMDLFSQVVNG